MANFTSYQDFFGSYSGDFDGRRATLEIGDVKADSVYPLFHIILTDLDRDEVYVGTHEERGQHGHIVADISLDQRGGGNTVYLSRLYLHTWNTDYLSGVSIWNNIEFGMSFTRI